MLISATYFQMKALIYECHSYFIIHIKEIAKLKFKTKIQNKEIIKKIGQNITIEKLNVLSQRNKIVNSVFKMKLLT